MNGFRQDKVPSILSQFFFFGLTALYCYTADSFADALNAVELSSSGAIRLVSAYPLLDLNILLNMTKSLRSQRNGNNPFNAHCFTQRPQFYPGPGIWPSDGPTLSATVAVKL